MDEFTLIAGILQSEKTTRIDLYQRKKAIWRLHENLHKLVSEKVRKTKEIQQISRIRNFSRTRQTWKETQSKSSKEGGMLQNDWAFQTTRWKTIRGVESTDRKNERRKWRK